MDRPVRRAAMAAIAALAIVAIAAAGCGQTTPTPTPTPTVSPLRSPDATATPTAPPATPGAMELTASTTEPLAPGRYTRSGFRPPVTFEVEGEWYGVQLFSGFFDIQRDVGSPDVIAVQLATPDALYGAGGDAVSPVDPATAPEVLGANPGLTVIETSGSRIGGLEGFQVTVENAGSSGAQVMRVPPGPLSILPGRRLWIALFDTPDGVLAIMVGGSVATWDEALLAAEPVLESIEIGD